MEGFGAVQELTRSDTGLWSITVGPLEPELWGYYFNVNGVRTLDPNNSLHKRDGTRVECILLIPGEASALYETREVPHGSLSKVWYESPTLNLTRRMYVYTPPGYENSSDSYPVLYLLHGSGGDEDAWSTLGRTCQILDNLIAQARAKPMIVVMPNGNETQAGTPGEIPTMAAQAGAAGVPGMGGARFAASLVSDIVPYIENNYRVVANKDNRAIAGLSMGGGHTIMVTTSNPGLFSYIGVFSSGPREGYRVEYDDNFKSEMAALERSGVTLYWVGCGVDDAVAETGAKNLVETLEEYGFNYYYRESTGGHTWANWRIYLSELAPLLFR